jgi:hypothetical protein
MQIMQFILGASYTMLHSFISYDVPVTMARSAHQVQPSPAAGTNAALQTASAALNSIKGLIFGSSKNGASAVVATTETVYVTQPCILTTGETYAIWMNVLYLAPLTYLFVSFFITSYLKRSNAANKIPGKIDRRLSNNVTLAEKAGWDAARGVEREVYGGENVHSDGSAIAEEDTPVKRTPKGKGKARRRA